MSLFLAKITTIDVFENRLDEIFSHLSNGGSLTEYCKLVKCDYSKLMGLIRRDPDAKKKYQDAISDRKEWAKERIYEELKHMSTYSIQDAVNPDGTLKRIQELPEALARSIKEVDADGGIKFADKLKALDQKQKLLGLNVEKVEISGELTLEGLILAAKKKKQVDNG